MDRWKIRGGQSQKGEEQRRLKKRNAQKKDDACAGKGRKVAIHQVFPVICGSGGSKSRPATGQKRDEKLHAVVARSKFRSQKC